MLWWIFCRQLNRWKGSRISLQSTRFFLHVCRIRRMWLFLMNTLDGRLRKCGVYLVRRRSVFCVQLSRHIWRRRLWQLWMICGSVLFRRVCCAGILAGCSRKSGGRKRPGSAGHAWMRRSIRCRILSGIRMSAVRI